MTTGDLQQHVRLRERALTTALRSLVPGVLALLLVACGGGAGGGDQASTQAAAAAGESVSRILSAATGGAGGLLINEVSAGAWKGAKDADGDAEDWVEIYNPGTRAVDMTGYGLSNKSASPFYWAFPAGTTVSAGGYLTVWLSKKDRSTLGQPLHANFNLDNGGDTVYLSASNATATGILVDSATPPLMRTDQTWCRMPNEQAIAPFKVCLQATFNAPNSGTSYAGVLAKPTLSLKSGFYAAAQTLSVTGPAGAALRYTTDGSEPTATSTLYSVPLTISASQVLRVGAFADGLAPSLPETGTYVISAAEAAKYATLKAIMVTIPPDAVPGFQAQDKTVLFRASFELILNNSITAFKMDAEGKAGGNAGSADSPVRTMNVAARDAFGPKSFPATGLWPDKPGITSVKKFRLRNGSNDWDQAHLRDQFSQRVSSGGPNLVASSSAVAMFLNGRYYGLMDLREREDETLPSSNLGIDKDWVDYLSDPYLEGQEIQNGGEAALAAYGDMQSFVTGNNMATAANYARAKTLLNAESVAYDWALHMFHANYDWPYHNVHVWRSPEVDGRWTWKSHDMDWAFGLYTGASYNMNSSFSGAGSTLINALLRNTEFRNLYLNTVADQINVMTPASLNTTLDGMAADLRPYIADNHAALGLGTAANWEARIVYMRDYFAAREPLYDTHNRSQFSLGVRQPIAVSVNDPAMGSVTVNSVDTRRFMSTARPRWQGSYYPGVPIALEAKPKPGYAFVGWQGASTATTRSITQTLPALSAAAFPVNKFSVRWSGTLEAPVSGAAQLQAVADDGVRVTFDGARVIDNWASASVTTRTANVTLVAGRRHSIVVEYYDASGTASIKLNWLLPGAAAFTPLPIERLFAPTAAATLPAASGNGLTGQYFANATLSGTPAFQRDEVVYVDWGTAGPLPTAAPVELTAVFTATTAPAAPVLAAVQAQAWRTGDIVNLKVSATDPGGYPITYSASTLPKGLSQNAVSGIIYGRITTPGSYASTLRASNGVSTGSLSLSWTVTDRPGTGLLGISPDSGPPTNVPPTVALTAPAANAGFVQGVAITVSASAADSDGSVARVEFYDGGTLIGSATAAPYSVSWTGAGLGAHTVSAKATDNLGAVATSAGVSITVTAPAPNVAPTVSLTAPTANASVAQGTAITVTASAADSDGSVVRVEFFDGGTLIGSGTAAPFSISWAGASLGAHTLTAKATDNAGASTTSAHVAITVAAPPTGEGTGTGLQGQYYASLDLSGNVALQRTEAVYFSWGAGSPGAGVPADFFSARWTGLVEALTAGSYQFQTNSDDGVRVWVNGSLVINNWTPHGPTLDTSAAITLAAGQRVSIVVEYQEYTGGATMQLSWKTPGTTSYVAVPASRLYAPGAVASSGTGLLGQYFSTYDLSGSVVLQRIEAVDFDWGTAAPGPGVPADFFSARWRGQVEADATGNYQFQTNSDDGVRVWVNGVLIINNWTPHGPTVDTSANIAMTTGQRYSIVVEYQEYTGGATMQLRWKPPGSTTFSEVPTVRLFPAAP